MGSVLNVKINTTKVPRENYFKGEKGVYLDLQISERKEPTQYGQTHTVSLKHKVTGEKIYIGDATLKVFESQPVSDSDLPPGVDDIEDAQVVEGDPKPVPF